ncbi:hypothetical protein [Mycobacterium uberis]|uniref:hypothetical protein n=1 Tax=Mycobacterium uberis TaxID=2162698 RepID=UPI001FB3D67F|nr:hypothetical protein [Mycobacterium uberis]
MWDVATLGRSRVGEFAQLGLWRWAFGAVAMVMMIALMALSLLVPVRILRKSGFPERRYPIVGSSIQSAGAVDAADGYSWDGG